MTKCTLDPSKQIPPRTGPVICTIPGEWWIVLQPGENDLPEEKAAILRSAAHLQGYIASGVLDIEGVAPKVSKKPAEFNSADYSVKELRNESGPLSRVNDIDLLRKEMEEDKRKGADKAMLRRIEELEAQNGG